MCYLAVYHPETKAWQLAKGNTLDSDSLYAVVHTDLHTTEQIAHVVCQEKWDGMSFYNSDTSYSPECASCKAIMQTLPHSEDRGNQPLDAPQI